MLQDLSWQQLINNWSDAELCFALQATTDTAPSATNLRRWGVANIDPACCLGGKPTITCHVLKACSVALQQGRYTWRHDSVLSVIRHHLHKFWEVPATQRAVEVTMASRSNQFIGFVPACTTLPLQSHQCRPFSTAISPLYKLIWPLHVRIRGNGAESVSTLLKNGAIVRFLGDTGTKMAPSIC